MEHTEQGSGDAREGKHGLRPAVSIDRTLVFTRQIADTLRKKDIYIHT